MNGPIVVRPHAGSNQETIRAASCRYLQVASWAGSGGVLRTINLLHLATDIQEQLLFLPRITEGQNAITERELWSIAAEVDGRKQREGDGSCR